MQIKVGEMNAILGERTHLINDIKCLFHVILGDGFMQIVGEPVGHKRRKLLEQ